MSIVKIKDLSSVGMVSAVDVRDESIISVVKVVIYYANYRIKCGSVYKCRACDLPTLVYSRELFSLERRVGLDHVQVFYKLSGEQNSRILRFFYPPEFSVVWDAFVLFSKGDGHD